MASSLVLEPATLPSNVALPRNNIVQSRQIDGDAGIAPSAIVQQQGVQQLEGAVFAAGKFMNAVAEYTTFAAEVRARLSATEAKAAVKSEETVPTRPRPPQPPVEPKATPSHTFPGGGHVLGRGQAITPAALSGREYAVWKDVRVEIVRNPAAEVRRQTALQAAEARLRSSVNAFGVAALRLRQRRQQQQEEERRRRERALRAQRLPCPASPPPAIASPQPTKAAPPATLSRKELRAAAAEARMARRGGAGARVRRGGVGALSKKERALRERKLKDELLGKIEARARAAGRCVPFGMPAASVKVLRKNLARAGTKASAMGAWKAGAMAASPLIGGFGGGRAVC